MGFYVSGIREMVDCGINGDYSQTAGSVDSHMQPGWLECFCWQYYSGMGSNTYYGQAQTVHSWRLDSNGVNMDQHRLHHYSGWNTGNISSVFETNLSYYECGLRKLHHSMQLREKLDWNNTWLGSNSGGAAGFNQGSWKTSNISMLDFIGGRYSRTSNYSGRSKGDGVDHQLNQSDTTIQISIGSAAPAPWNQQQQ